MSLELPLQVRLGLSPKSDSVAAHAGGFGAGIIKRPKKHTRCASLENELHHLRDCSDCML